MKSLIFITIRGDLDDVIKNSLENILKQVDNIVDIDLSVLSNMTKNVANGKLAFIGKTLDKAIDGYGHLKEVRTDFIKGINDGFKAI